MCVGRYGQNVTATPMGLIKYAHQSNTINDRKNANIKQEYGAVSLITIWIKILAHLRRLLSFYRYYYGVTGVSRLNVNQDVCMVNLDDYVKEVLVYECILENVWTSSEYMEEMRTHFRPFPCMGTNFIVSD